MCLTSTTSQAAQPLPRVSEPAACASYLLYSICSRPVVQQQTCRVYFRSWLEPSLQVDCMPAVNQRSVSSNSCVSWLDTGHRPSSSSSSKFALVPLIALWLQRQSFSRSKKCQTALCEIRQKTQLFYTTEYKPDTVCLSVRLFVTFENVGQLSAVCNIGRKPHSAQRDW